MATELETLHVLLARVQRNRDSSKAKIPVAARTEQAARPATGSPPRQPPPQRERESHAAPQAPQSKQKPYIETWPELRASEFHDVFSVARESSPPAASTLQQLLQRSLKLRVR